MQVAFLLPLQTWQKVSIAIRQRLFCSRQQAGFQLVSSLIFFISNSVWLL
jgi:hypothetical protein